MRKASIIILAVLLALFAFVSCDQSVGDLFGFDLMFNANGGTGLMEPVFIKGTSTTAPASAYTRTGYTFTGWNTEHDGSGTEYKVGDVINGYDTLSIKLYAQWVANTYQITIGSAQHGYASALTYQYKTDEVTEQVIPLNIFAEEGYRFSYFTITGGASVDVNNGYLLIPAGNASDITITPNFSANDYVVVYNANGGTGTMDSQSFTFDEQQNLTANAFTKSGYEFANWSTTEGGMGEDFYDEEPVTNLASEKGQTVVLYAQWNAVPYTITVADVEHGYAEVMFDTYTVSNENIFIPVTPEPYPGYSLDSFTVDNAGAKIDPFTGNLVIYAGTTGDITITPSFIANEYRIRFDANCTDASGSMSFQFFNFDEAQQLKENAYTRTGYTFAGWNTKADGRGTAFFDMEEVLNLTTSEYATLTLYAQWEIVPYTIKSEIVEHGFATPMFDGYTIGDSDVFIPVTVVESPGYHLADLTVDNEGAYFDVFTYNLVIEAGTTGDINITATFLPNLYFVEFDANCTDATGVMPTETMYFDMEKELEPVEYAREGYTFAGWNTEPDGTGIPYFDKEVVSNLSEELIDTVTLYAQWNPTVYFVYFTDVEHGYATALYNMYIVDGDDTYIPLHAVADKGYMFIMFEVAEGPAYIDVSGEYLVIPAGSASDIEVIPHFWIRPYSINITESTQGTVLADEILYTMSDEDQTVELTVIPEVGNALFDWKFDGPLGITIKDNILTIPAGAVGDITITPIFLPAFQVTLVKNGGTVEEGYDVTQYFFAEETALPTAEHFKKTGYTFDGWFDNDQYEGNPVTVITRGTSGDKTYYANWTPNTYSVKFNGNGSTSGSMSDQSFTYGVAQNLTANGFEKTGHTFNVWNTVATPTTEVPGTTYANQANVKDLTSEKDGVFNLYAQWTANTYTVTLNTNGGTIAEGKNVTSYTYGVGATLPAVTSEAADITRTGYTFGGWYDNEQCTGTAVTAISTTDLGNKTYYAKWTANVYTVTLNTNGGTIAQGKEVTSYTYGVGATLPTAADITKTGYTFGGWYDNEQCTGTAVTTISTTDTGNKTFYAKWTAITYTVKFDKNTEAATGSMTDQSFVYDVSKKLKVNTFKNVGYSFNGWNTASDGTGTSYADKATVQNLTSDPDGEVTLYAQWTQCTYSITFTSGTEGYTVTPTESTYQYDPENPAVIQLTITGAVPHIDSYAINGPTTASVAFDKENSSVTIQSGSYGGPIVVTCYFVTDYKTITFKANGGEGDDTTENVPTGVEWELDANPFTYEGKVFAGWSTSEDGDVEFANEGKITTVEDMTLYAKWNEPS